MKIVYAIIVLIMILGVIGTLFAAGNVSTDYDKSTKRNITNLSFIYVVLFIGLIAGLWYTIATI